MDDLRYPDAVVGKQSSRADLLNFVMAGVHAPRSHGAFVLPYLIGEQQVFARQTLEAIDEEAAAHRRKGGLQCSGEAHVTGYVSFLYLDFKELRNHQEILRA
jgi:hypothetical protein